MLDVQDASQAATKRTHWRALVADDATATHLALGAAIRADDPTTEILEARTGKQALDLMVQARPDIAFINVKLPEMSGAEALAWAKAQNAQPFTILLSSLVLPRWVEVSIELDAYEFLKKPFDPDHILHLLNAFRRKRAPLRALLVESSPTGRQLIQRVLLGSGFNLSVDETDSGAHALKLMRAEAYDVALIDTALSGMDGLETAVNARDISPDTRLILMSSGDPSALRQAARHFGLSFCLRKPFYVRDVDHALHSALNLRRPYLLNALIAGSGAAGRKAAVR